MRLPGMKAIVSLFLAAILSAPAWAADNTRANSAVPGTLNYVEGQVSIGDQTLNSKSIGSVNLQGGQSLTTGNGKAEVLLTPGVFLRVGEDSSVKMISPSITNTQVELDKGHAMVEVAEIHPENDIRISTSGTRTELLKTGLYDFNLNQNEFRIFDGKARLEGGEGQVTVKSGHEVSLASNETLKPQKFDKKTYEEGDLYRWSSLRSAYLAEANVDAASYYMNYGWGPWGLGWWGADWYWDPWFDAFTFIPGDGIFFSPFGWGFYSPWWVYRAPFYGYGYGYGRYYHHFSTDYHNWGPGPHYAGSRTYAHGVYRGPGSAAGGGFHSGPRRVAGGRGFFGGPRGGFGGARGGFHGGAHTGGGGFGGGFHGIGGGAHGR